MHKNIGIIVMAVLLVVCVLAMTGATHDAFIQQDRCGTIDIWVDLSIQAENAILSGDMDTYNTVNGRREWLLNNI